MPLLQPPWTLVGLSGQGPVLPYATAGHVSLVRVEIVIDRVRVIGHFCNRWDTPLKLCLTRCLFLERWWAASSMTASKLL
jgi:hypothetical protein